MILDPAKTYADIQRSKHRVVALVTGLSQIPDWALQGDRLIVEVPVGVTVLIGYFYYAGSFRAPPAATVIDGSNIDILSKIEKSLGLLTAQYAGKTPAQAKADFKTIYQSLP